MPVTSVLWDALRRIQQTTTLAGNTTYAYYLDGAVSSVTDATGTTSFGEDQLGRLSSTLDPVSGLSTSYVVDALGRLTQRNEANGNRTLAGYSGIDQLNLKTITKPGGASPFASWSNTYDFAGNRTGETGSQPNDPISGLSTFGYDTVQRLNSATQPTQPPGLTYGYDAAHNRTSAGAVSFGYQTNNAVSTENPGSIGYVPDDDGNQTKDNLGRVYKYDSINRIQEVRDPTGVTVLVSYTYDGLGRLLTRTDTGGSLQLVYRGLEDQVVKAILGASSRSYAWDTRGRMLLEKLPDATLWTIATNPHGDIVGVDNGSGTAPAIRHYDAWGQPVSSVDTTTSQVWAVLFGYQGGWTDPLTGQVRMGVRWYDPHVARFTSSDPAAAGADLLLPMAGHRWLYGRNNPLGYRDPTGLDSGCICFDDGGSGWAPPPSPQPKPVCQDGGCVDPGSYGGGYSPQPRPSPAPAPRAQTPWWQQAIQLAVKVDNYLLNVSAALDQASRDLDPVAFVWNHAEEIADGNLANSWWGQASGASSFFDLVADAKNPDRIRQDPAKFGLDVVGVLPGIGVVGKAGRAAKLGEVAVKAGTELRLAPKAATAVQVVRSAAESDRGEIAATLRGGESAAAANGRAIHETFDQGLRDFSQTDRRFQPGLRSGPNRPDGFFEGQPIELKPNTPSGLSAGRGQLRRYMGAFGADRGYLFTYDRSGNIFLAVVLSL